MKDAISKDVLSAKQIDSWRTMLIGMLGPYALLMTDEQIIEERNKFQQRIDTIARAEQ